MGRVSLRHVLDLHLAEVQVLDEARAHSAEGAAGDPVQAGTEPSGSSPQVPLRVFLALACPPEAARQATPALQSYQRSHPCQGALCVAPGWRSEMGALHVATVNGWAA